MITITATIKRNNGNAVIYYKQDDKSKSYTGHWTGRDDYYKINNFPEKGDRFYDKQDLIDWLREGGDWLIIKKRA